MSHWNYRVMRHRYDDEDILLLGVTHWYGIHEVFYEDDGSVRNWTEDAMAPQGDTFAELQSDAAMMAEALLLPILDYDNKAEALPA